MKKATILLMIVLLSLVLPVSSAQDLNEFSVILDVTQKVSNAEYTIVLSAPFEGQVEIPLLKETGSINVYDKKTNEDIAFVKHGAGITFNISAQKNRIIAVNTYFSDIVADSDSSRIIKINQQIPENLDLFEFNIKLPQGYIVSELENEMLVVPEPDNILSDGKHIILNWRISSPIDDFEVFAAYEPLKRDFSAAYLVIVALITLGLVFAIIFLFFKFSRRESRIITVGLSDDEKKVYDAIKEKKEISQKNIQKKLNFSKPRLSRLIRNLEQAGMIEKKPLGRTNILSVRKL